MEATTEDANSKFFPANEPDVELYTVPSHSGWFSWDEIHETEKTSLKEFFHGFSISKTPKIYKEYRDFIINKYREDPSRRITFTEIRKSLIGDVSLIHKVFLFLEKWGLINYGVPAESSEDEEKEKVRFEEGAPNGVRVVAVPNLSKTVPLMPYVGGSNGDMVDNGFRLPPLASYLDVFGEQQRPQVSVCKNCGEVCTSGSPVAEKKHSSVTCIKCAKTENNGESKDADNSKLKDCKDGSDNHGSESWTDAETLLLLESVLKHGDDWDLVAQDVQSKNRSDCISRLIQLPFGDLMLSRLNRYGDYRNFNGTTSNIKQIQSTSVTPQTSIEKVDFSHKQIKESDHTENGETEEPPLKKRRTEAFADASDSLMKQVAVLSTAVSPHVASAAAEAAITALCEENPYARVILEGEEDNITNVFQSPSLTRAPERLLEVEEPEMVEKHPQSEDQEGTHEKDSVSQTLRIRTAIATALGAAAARAKQLADQEDREVERLVATVIETQLKKIHCKIKHFEELQLIMDKEHTQIQELKQSIIDDRINVLQRVFEAGVPRWRDRSSIKPSASSVFS